MIQTIKDLENQLHLIPEPTHLFNIGDSVDIGNLRDVIVNNIFFNGKGYEIDYTSVNHNYGRPIDTKHCKMIVSWLDIRKINDNKESFVTNENIFLQYSQRELTDIFSKKYFFGIDMNPEYQRDYVWEEFDKVNLIDSIFNNIDIGKFVFNKLPYRENSPSYEIVDGKQRINALCEFYEDRFKYKDKYFSELSKKDQNHFKYYSISSAEISYASKKEIMQVFLMINSNGKIMDKEHLDKIRKEYENCEICTLV